MKYTTPATKWLIEYATSTMHSCPPVVLYMIKKTILLSIIAGSPQVKATETKV